ncbi:hypothetical protein Salat_0891500 [Sesamum alatum]|uniref:Uncharacterized protein n=1 Tax=Sesamum alatum TaxID=300844 RepID=A0AAE1YJ62_9LAMI|nr:hypothetical protein Salat_0891500 [Sesamum alatum]
MKFCECQYEPDFDEKQDSLPFGPWLLATTPSFLRSRGVSTLNPRPAFDVRSHSGLHHTDTPRRGPAIFQYNPLLHSQTSAPTQPDFVRPPIPSPDLTLSIAPTL